MELERLTDIFRYLRCPVTKNGLIPVPKDKFPDYGITVSRMKLKDPDSGLVDKSGKYFYPVFDGIIVLHEYYAVFLGKGEDLRGKLSKDKKRVFDYYNELNYKTRKSYEVYEDSPKWVDSREVSSEYMKNSFSKASVFYPRSGDFFLDIASGPVGLPEYMDLSDGYQIRICIDVSINALLQAKKNMEKAGKKGIYICGDITNIPVTDNVCDTVLSQHTLYHIPKREQKTAVNELYRVAKKGSKIVIVYSWFYHSWFMNLSLNIFQLYRIARHFAGKLYVRLFRSKPRLYFYSHSPSWFRKTFDFSDEMKFYCWRSTNKYFLNFYIHKWLSGERILNRIRQLEDKNTGFMGTFGEHPAIVITKEK